MKLSAQKTYRRLYDFLEQETHEPALSWGLRMGIAAVVPLIWGIATGHEKAAEFISLTAEMICWVELKGGYAQRLRTLLAGIALTFFFGFLGSIIGLNIWWSTLAMFFVGVFSALSKNLGDRGSSLAICMYVIFLIANAQPTITAHELGIRCLLILIGGFWNLIIGLIFTAFMPLQQPYRTSISAIWRNIARLAETIASGWDGKGQKSGVRDIYLMERNVRAELDTSLALYEGLAGEVKEQDTLNYKLAQVRKATALAAAQLSAIALELMEQGTLPGGKLTQVKIYDVINNLKHCANRMAGYIFSLREEELLLVNSSLERIESARDLLEEENNDPAVLRMVQLAGRYSNLVRRCLSLLEKEEDKRVFRSYSLVKTILILHPKHWWRNIRTLFNFNSHTLRYALRTGLAAAIGLFLYKYFDIPHGYWLPFTIITIAQPYFGATLRKAGDRILGTLLGSIAGSLLLFLPAALHIKEVMLFISSVLMVRYIRTRYSVATFFITLSLVLLFSVAEEFDLNLLFIRALVTLAGAGIAILAGFLLLPAWDKKWLPRHIIEAVSANYRYFLFTFSKEPGTWTRYKRIAETANANAFDSFNRYMQEAAHTERPYAAYYQIIAHNVRITRYLNNIHLEREELSGENIEAEHELIYSCEKEFNAAIDIMRELDARRVKTMGTPDLQRQSIMNDISLVYLEKLYRELKTLNTGLETLQHKKQS